MSYHVQHSAYCGMSGLLHTFDTEAEARSYVAGRLRSYRRQEYPIATLKAGSEWEIQEPDDCLMVPDACGTLSLWRETVDCRECGGKHDTKEEAYACCLPQYDEYDWEEAEEEAYNDD